ncbi:hypothetical protein ACH5RR_029378 [Cinchona calisaya]|uniref:Uncharacterized protein n=1 Tax=Cinchona calisaya TaxID=153742 RepID=A0ABD2YUT1_9GENT
MHEKHISPSLPLKLVYLMKPHFVSRSLRSTCDDYHQSLRAKGNPKPLMKEKEIIDMLSDSKEVVHKPCSRNELQFKLNEFLFQMHKKLPPLALVDEEGF